MRKKTLNKHTGQIRPRKDRNIYILHRHIYYNYMLYQHNKDNRLNKDVYYFAFLNEANRVY